MGGSELSASAYTLRFEVEESQATSLQSGALAHAHLRKGEERFCLLCSKILGSTTVYKVVKRSFSSTLRGKERLSVSQVLPNHVVLRVVLLRLAHANGVVRSAACVRGRRAETLR